MPAPRRRQHWLASAREHSTQLAQACAAVAQFEVSRQGLVWAPGEEARALVWALVWAPGEEARAAVHMQVLGAVRWKVNGG